MQNKKRYLVLVVVAGGHAVVLGMLLSGSRIASLSSPDGASIETFIITPSVRRPLPFTRPRINGRLAPIAPLEEPISMAPPVLPATSPSRGAIDWNAAARQAAAAILEPGKRISFGFPPGGKSAITLGVPSPSSPAHYAGESDRTIGGEDTEWISDRCYVISDPPIPGEPDFLAHARVTRGGCLPPPGPDPGELFKNLPAYKKYHPKE